MRRRENDIFSDDNKNSNNNYNSEYRGTVIPFIIVVALISEIIFLGFFFAGKIQKYVYPQKFSETVYKYSDEYDVPIALVYATMKTESDFDCNAVSSAGACGIMQIMPGTFETIADDLSEDVSPSDIFNPQINIKYGIIYLSEQYKSFGCWEYAILAYNAGPQRVSQWLDDNKINVSENRWDIPIEESADYIKKIRKCADKYSRIYDMEEIKWKS